MQKIKAIILTTLLLMAMTIALFPIANASTGQILIDTTTAPSPAISVPAGGNINLFTGNVMWSGGLVYLILGNASQGFSDTQGVQYTPTFSVSDIQASAVKTVTGTTQYPGTWTLGYNWINGSIPSAIAGGNYFIKAFDGAVTFLAVTDRTFLVTGALSIVPSVGPGGASLTIKGNAFPAGGLANVSYVNPLTLAIVKVQDYVMADGIGAFSIPFTAPDILGPVVNIAGDNVPPATNAITFNAKSINETGMPTYSAIYTEGQRGILQFGRPKSAGVTGSVQNATGVFGNLTSFSSTLGLSPGVAGAVTVGVNDKLRLAGNWFYPGTVSITWDNSIAMTTATTNETGFFNVTTGLTVPVTGLGLHNITLIDANNAKFVIFLNVIQSITISPTSGPVGTIVTVKGYGFPAATPTHAENVTIFWDGTLGTELGTRVAWKNPDATGYFEVTFVVPTAIGGAHTVVATSNETLTSASKTFTVKATFYVTPDSFANTGDLIVKAIGIGFDPTNNYICNIDNQQLGTNSYGNTYQTNVKPNATGYLEVQFIGTGFRPGQHVFSLYADGELSPGIVGPEVFATFTVLDTGDAIIAKVLAVNDTLVAKIGTLTTTLTTNLAALDAKVVAIQGSIATLQTSIGTVSATVSSLGASISNIQSGIATVNTNFGTVNTKLSSLDAVVGLIAGDTAQLKTSLGTVTTSLESINPKLTAIQGSIATIQTDVGTLQGTVTSINNGVATVQTGVGSLQTSVGSLNTSVSSMQTEVTEAKNNSANVSTLVIIAIVIALIAAIAAIFSIFLIRQKIAS